MFTWKKSTYRLQKRRYLRNQDVYLFSLIFFPSVGLRPDSGSRHPLRGFAITLIGRTILGRIPLDERSAQCTDLYLTTHEHSQRTNIHAPPGFQPTKRATERQQSDAFDRAATGTGDSSNTKRKFKKGLSSIFLRLDKFRDNKTAGLDTSRGCRETGMQ